jgi:hypothetical protein
MNTQSRNLGKRQFSSHNSPLQTDIYLGGRDYLRVSADLGSKTAQVRMRTFARTRSDQLAGASQALRLQPKQIDRLIGALLDTREVIRSDKHTELSFGGIL